MVHRSVLVVEQLEEFRIRCHIQVSEYIIGVIICYFVRFILPLLLPELMAVVGVIG